MPNLLPIEFVSSEIVGMMVNGVRVSGVSQDEFLLIPKVYLFLGVNTMTVYYRNEFNNDGAGCISYTDVSEATPKQYIYTHFEPYGAHRLFPCFDQPDLKATAFFSVILSNPDWISKGNDTANIVEVYTEAAYRANIGSINQQLLGLYLAGKEGRFFLYP
jgi:aminopeptidase N